VIRFGVSPIAWANDDMPELGGDTPLESILAEIRDVGFEGVELGGKFPKIPGELGTLLKCFDLSLVGGWFSGNALVHTPDQEIAALQEHLALLKAMGCKVFIYAETSNAIHGQRPTPLTQTPRLKAEDWPRFGKTLTAVADHVQAQGLKFAYHHHLGTVVERAEDIRDLVRHTGSSVGLTLDTGHAALGGIAAVSAIRDWPERIAHVHCKGIRRTPFRAVREQDKSFLDGVLDGMFTVPGDGDLDFAPIIAALAEIDYSGWIIVEAEQDPKLANPRRYAELGLNTLKTLARAEGMIS
jgi:inosose dehydratase